MIDYFKTSDFLCSSVS